VVCRCSYRGLCVHACQAWGAEMRPNRLFDTDAELASFSLTLEPNGESDQWGND
jgi:hypothetical protein